MTDTARPWTEADVHRLATFITGHPDATPSPHHLAATRALLGGLAQEGRIADPQELERLRESAAISAHNAKAAMHWQGEALKAERERNELRARVAELEQRVAAGEASDGHHTHNELYLYRLLYNAHAAAGWHRAGIPVVKSWKHSTGELCFGGGWFIVTAELPTGQVSNHYAAGHWYLFGVPEVDLPPEWDGHTPTEAADRLREHLEQAARCACGQPADTIGRYELVASTFPCPDCPPVTAGGGQA